MREKRTEKDDPANVHSMNYRYTHGIDAAGKVI